MYKTKKINNKLVYYSDKLNIEHFFTTRELVVKENLDEIAKYLNIKKTIKKNTPIVIHLS